MTSETEVKQKPCVRCRRCGTPTHKPIFKGTRVVIWVCRAEGCGLYNIAKKVDWIWDQI